MNVILFTVRWQSAFVYLDDIENFSESQLEHIGHVRTVLKLLHNAGVTLKLNKCRLLTKTRRLARTAHLSKTSLNSVTYEKRYTWTEGTNEHH